MMKQHRDKSDTRISINDVTNGLNVRVAKSHETYLQVCEKLQVRIYQFQEVLCTKN